ncbi:MAG: transposase [Glomeribacter sp. 1016415]|nr:transposase [Glomeribacter sp. 1016415]
MSKIKRARYRLEYKTEAIRLVGNSKGIAAVARRLGIADQMLHNWIRAYESGNLVGSNSKPIYAEQMEISRLRAELVRVKMERDILKKATTCFTRGLV